jgi:hypothetical protein
MEQQRAGQEDPEENDRPLILNLKYGFAIAPVQSYSLVRLPPHTSHVSAGTAWVKFSSDSGRIPLEKEVIYVTPEW